MKMPMDLTEVKLRRKDVFEGKIMTVHVDDVRLPNGEEATREVDRKSTRLNSSHPNPSRMPSSA